jgi:hypothetical protein
MPKFGNINETNITDYPLWGNFYLWKGKKKGKVIIYLTQLFSRFALMIYKVIK